MKLTALAGGVGAARLLSGLVEVFPPEDLTVIVNTGDDFRWMGLYVCPDIDTVTYTLAGLANPLTGWGIRDDTFHALDRLGQLGGETWFKIGDRDLATHILRTSWIQSGRSLTEVTQDLCRLNGVTVCTLPMTNSHAPTMVETEEGILDFQEYFVHRRCLPAVRGFSYRGMAAAAPAPGVMDAILKTDAIVLCPSNPYISIGPILAVPGVRAALLKTPARILAVSPIVGGEAIKGPAASMMRQLGDDCSPAGVARMYRDFLDIFVLDRRDESLAGLVSDMGIEAQVADTVMDSRKSSCALAALILRLLK